MAGMTLHLVKLCVGCDTVQDLAEWQVERLKELKRARKKPELCHRTLQTPKRAAEILDGGSLYWVIKGFILVRQRIVALRADVKDDGSACCGIVLDPKLVTTRPRSRRAFQGWRYLYADDAPPDRRAVSKQEADMPPAMRAALRELRLIDF
jgi:hypothetical protein